ncbi:MAG TPA: alpha/beta hydrolase [Thermoanaerobaculia bacterium]|nr:alpha/beta hydrolase [Thermoanaerobaculia bacterium]
MKWRTIHRWWVRIGSVVLVVFLAWNLIAFQAWGVPGSALRSGGCITVEENTELFRFEPCRARKMGLVFFPGSLVAPKAYVPFLRSVAEAGHPTVLVKLPLRGYSTEAAYTEGAYRARKVLESGSWMVGGHSKGGFYAAEYAGRNPEAGGARGLILVGTTHPRDRDLSGLAIPVTKILATQDWLASPERAKENAARLPPGTRWVLIRGGNHSQFGYYGFQFGDRFAAISRDQQQRELVAAVIAALRSGDLSGDAAEQAGRH